MWVGQEFMFWIELVAEEPFEVGFLHNVRFTEELMVVPTSCRVHVDKGLSHFNAMKKWIKGDNR
jgi:hypothetical protein